METDPYANKKQQLEREIQKLQEQVELIKTQQRKPAIESILRTMHEYEITLEDIATILAPNTPTTRKPGKPAPIKFRHPDTGATWSGRGKAPNWLTAEESQGKARQEFLVDPPEPPTPD